MAVMSNRLKLAAMILVIAENENINRTSLNKLLFFSEMLHYINKKELISNVNYLKNNYGPVPEDIRGVRDALINENLLEEKSYDYGSHYEFFYKTLYKRPKRTNYGFV